MASLDSAQHALFAGDTWSWWQARRLRYNLTLAAAGWIAYFAAVALNYAFGHAVWADPRGAIGVTLFMGTWFLVVMGIANVCYLLGPAVEAWVRPADLGRYRRTAFAMGLWGSFAVPFVFPLVNLALLVGKG
jgi:hypothetical protein